MKNKLITFRSLVIRHVVSDFAWGGANAPPQAIEFRDVFFIEFLNAWKRADHTTPTPRHVLANLNGIVILPEYILTNSHFQLEKNEIVIEY